MAKKTKKVKWTEQIKVVFLFEVMRRVQENIKISQIVYDMASESGIPKLLMCEWLANEGTVKLKICECGAVGEIVKEERRGKVDYYVRKRCIKCRKEQSRGARNKRNHKKHTSRDVLVLP